MLHLVIWLIKSKVFQKTAIENFGISELTAKRTASTYMAMAKGMGIVDDVASDMAITMTGLTADIASFYNMSQERADVILKSVYTGETETLKQLGIVMTEVNLENFAMSQGITKSLSAMTQQEKTMLRYQFVLEQTALTQGDFVRTQDSWANQTRILAERWKEMQALFGDAFMTIGVMVLPVINSIIQGMTKIAQATQVVAQWIYKAFTGKELKSSTTTTQQQATALSGVGASAEDAAGGVSDLGKETKKAGKEAKKAIAGFDDLQIISSAMAESAEKASGTGGVGGLGGTAGGDIGETKVDFSLGEEDGEKATWLSERLKELSAALGGIKDIDMTNFSNGLQKLKQPLKEIAEVQWNILLWGIENVIVPLTEFTVEEALPRFFDTLGIALDFFKSILEGGWGLIKQLYNEFLIPIANYAAEPFLAMWDTFNGQIQKICGGFSRFHGVARFTNHTGFNL